MNVRLPLRRARVGCLAVAAKIRESPVIAAAIAGLVLLGALGILFAKTQDAGAKRQAEALAQLALAKAIDTRWDIAVLEARSDARAPHAPIMEANELTQIETALDAAARALPTRVFQAGIGELKKSYADKAELLARFAQANGDARQALTAAMRADAAVGALVRAAWREFPQRERLVAAENLVGKVLAQAQAYDRAPTTEQRTALQGHTAELASAHTLPRGVQAGLARLESDVHQLLLLKPLEQTLWERLAALATRARLDETAAILHRKQVEEAAGRERYRVYLLLYVFTLLVAAAYAASRLVARYRALEARHAELELALADASSRLDSAGAAGDPDDEPVEIVFRPYRGR